MYSAVGFFFVCVPPVHHHTEMCIEHTGTVQEGVEPYSETVRSDPVRSASVVQFVVEITWL